MKVEYLLDILKPHVPSIDNLARNLIKLTGVNRIEIKVEEIDQKTTSITAIIAGSGEMSLDEIVQNLDANNCALHSVDRIIVEE